MARLVVEEGYPISEVAARFQCSWSTVKRWVDRYLARRSARRRGHLSPNKTPLVVTKRVVSLRLRLREGPVRLAARVGIAALTVHQALRRCRITRLSDLDRATAKPVRRYEHDRPVHGRTGCDPSG